MRHAVRRRCGVRGQNAARPPADAAPGRGPGPAGRAGGVGAVGTTGRRHGGRPGTGRHAVMTDWRQRDLDDIRRKWVPDARLGVWEVTMERERLVGCTTSRQALQALRRFAADAGLAAEVALLPDASVGEDRAVVVTAAIAPLLEAPDIRADRVSEALHGEALAVLEERAGGGAGDGSGWLRVRMADGYHAWTHAGYVATGPEDWATDWIGRAGARSHGAELRFDDGRLRLPIGARLAVRRDGRVEAADGRIGIVAAGTVRSVAELAAEARLVPVPEWAWRWFGGAPYRWGGRTEWGIRSEEHTSGLPSRLHLVCRLLCEKTKPS